MADGTVTIKAAFDGKDAESGVSRIKSALGGLKDSGSKVGSVFKSVLGANLVTGAITAGLGTIQSGLSSMVGELTGSTMAWQTFDGNLKQLGFGRDQINEAKSEMQDYATKTVYSASEMAGTYAQLAAVGVKDTGKLVKAFGGLAGAAENPSQAMKTLSQQATQMAAKPNVAWGDFKLMLEQTPAGMAAVAKSMGMTTSELVTAVQDGKVKTDDFFQAMIDTAGDANSAFQKMATTPKTVGQAMDGLREGVANKFLPAFEKLNSFGIRGVEALSGIVDKVNFDKVADSLGKFLESIDIEGIVNNVSNAFAKISGLVKSFFATVGDTGLFLNLGDTISVFGDLASTVFNTLAGDAALFGDLSESIGDVFNIALFAIQDLISGAQSLFTSFSNTGAIKAVSAAFYDLVKAGLDLSEKLSGSIPWEAIGAAAGHVVKFIAQIAQAVAKFSQSLSGNAWRGIVTGIGGALVAFKAFNFLKGFNPFSAFSKNAEGSMSGASQAIGRAQSTIAQILRGLASVIRSIGSSVAIAAKGIGSGLAAAFRGIGQALAIANPVSILAVGGAIAVVVASFTLLATQGQGVATIIQSAGVAFGTVASVLIGAFARAIVTVSGVLPVVASSLSLLSPLVLALGEAFASVIVAAGEAAPRFAVLAAAIGGSISQIIGATAGLVVAFVPIAQVVSETFIRITQIVAESIVQIIQTLAPFIPAVTETVVALAPVLESMVEAFNNLISQIGPIIDSLTNLLETFGEQVRSILDGASGVVESFGSAIRDVLDGVAGIFESMGNAAKNAGQGVKLMAQGIKILVDLKLGDLVATLAAVATGLSAIATSGIATAGPGLQAAGVGMQMIATSARLASVAIRMLPATLATLSANLTTLPAQLTVAGIAMATFATGAQTSAVGWMVISSAIAQFPNMMTAIALAAAVASVGISSFNDQVGATGSAMSRLGSDSSRASSAVASLGAVIGPSISRASSVIASLGNIVGLTMAKITSTARSGMTNMTSAVRNGGSQMVATFRATGTQLVTAAQSMVNQAVNTVRAGYGAMVSAGHYIGRGLAVGMDSALGAVTAAANALVSQAERAAQAKAKINSPSHLFRDQVGWWIGLGIAKGIDNSAPEVANSLDYIRAQVAGFNVKMNDVLGSSTAKLSSQLKVETLRGKTPKAQSDARQEAYVAHSASLLEDVIDGLAALKEQVAQGQLIALDTGALVGGTVGAYDSAFGFNQALKGRHEL